MRVKRERLVRDDGVFPRWKIQQRTNNRNEPEEFHVVQSQSDFQRRSVNIIHNLDLMLESTLSPAMYK